MSRKQNIVSMEPEALRLELKTWEQAFLKANRRKPGRDDIKKNAEIAAKYKRYDNLRRRPPEPQTTPSKGRKSTPNKAERDALQERSVNAIVATPNKMTKVEEILRPPGIQAIPEEEPTPAHIRCALGPTPQKDGAVLSIFDALSAGTPSKGTSQMPVIASEALVAGTPSKSKPPFSPEPNLSRTPQSISKRYFLDTFAGTPLKRKREGDHTTPGTAKKLFATPTFLRRKWPLSHVDEDHNEETAPARQPFKKRPLVRSLSTIIQGLKKQEEKRMDDEWDIMNEIEAEERGESAKPAPPKVLVEDSQVAEMPLGPDKGVESSEDEGEGDPGALDANGNPRKVWKKKGLKRQTRRVIMRPVVQRAKTATAPLQKEDKGSGDDGDEMVEETQVAEAPRRAKKGEDSEFEDDEGSEAEDRHDSQQSRHEKGSKSAPKPGKKKQGDVAKEKKRKMVKPEAHANFRKLKIKNKNSKASGRGGRFGRR